MPGPVASIGTVPCAFHLVVHEATQIPAGCRSLSVAWRKGVQVASTGFAAVHDSCAKWESAISIKCVLFRGAAHDGQVRCDAKFCWLEVARDGGGVLGHAQLDLADCCDGQPHMKVLQVWSPSPPLVDLRLRVSIQAHTSVLENVAPALPPQSLPPQPCIEATGPMKDAAACLQILDWESLLRDAGAHLAPPARSCAALAAQQPAGPQHSALPHRQTPAGGCTPRGGKPAVASPSSAYGTHLNQLPARLVALCNRQCLASGLTSVQQEDALGVFLAALRHVRDPLPASGIVFSTVPLRPQAPALPSADAPARAPGTPDSADTPARPRAAAGPGTPPLPPEAAGAPYAAGAPALPGAAPGDSMISGFSSAAASAEGVPSVSTRHMYELLSHLSDIRSLALTLDFDDRGGFDSERRTLFASPSFSLEESPALGSSASAGALQSGELGSAAGPDAALQGAPHANLVVSQIIHGVDEAAGIGGQVLKDVGAELGDLSARLHELSRDRELWLHRFHAMRELQCSSAFCERAARADQPDLAVPAT